ncbi:MAG TPA: hypothetical protein VFB21_03975 [Chthonomonadaceae bacterium]|nr:hypothetical protein [Chthonomonadaceae bacterium]
MSIRNVIPLAVCAFALGSLGSAHAQAPFTIRRPPDGATVKEKVRVEIPRGSIRPGSFVGFFIDDKFAVALAPPDPTSPEGRGNKPFTFIWDTKQKDAEGNAIPDGEHSIKAILYEPVAGSNTAAEPKAESVVRVIVANKIKADTGPLSLRYKYREGENLTYSRDSKSVVVSALSDLGSTSDQELAEAISRHILDIEDARPDVSLVRNKLTRLTLEQNGQQMTLDPSQLSVSMYQELDPLGRVHYETGENSGLEQFTAQGLPVNNTLELPLLPYARVAIGDTWRTPNQRLDIPGLPPSLQPRVDLNNKLEALEWEGGRPTAKILQTYEGTVGDTIQFGPVSVTSPKITYERVLYIAYKSGTLVKSVRTLTVTGRTSDPIPTPGQVGGAAPGMAGGFRGAPGMMPGMMGPGGRAGMMAAGGFPGMPGGFGAAGDLGDEVRGGRGGLRGMGGIRGGFPGGPGGYRGGPGMMGPAMAGGPGGYRGLGGGRAGMMGQMGLGGGFPGGMPGGLGARGFGGNRGGVIQQETDRPVTLKSITVTELVSQSTSRR